MDDASQQIILKLDNINLLANLHYKLTTLAKAFVYAACNLVHKPPRQPL